MTLLSTISTSSVADFCSCRPGSTKHAWHGWTYVPVLWWEGLVRESGMVSRRLNESSKVDAERQRRFPIRVWTHRSWQKQSVLSHPCRQRKQATKLRTSYHAPSVIFQLTHRRRSNTSGCHCYLSNFSILRSPLSLLEVSSHAAWPAAHE